MAMILHPEVMKRAQDAIDTIVGRDRLPTLDELNGIPYLTAVLKEVFRWRPITPLGTRVTLRLYD